MRRVFRQRVEISMERYLHLIRLEERVNILKKKLEKPGRDFIEVVSVLDILEMEKEND